MKHQRSMGVCLLLILTTVLTACSAAPAGPQIKIEDAWGRPSTQMMMNGAFYMNLKNSGGAADKLTGATSSACGVVELHETYKTPEGAMGMRPVPGGFIEVPAGGAVELKPGGMHVMCIDKKEAFAPGSKVPLTLKFETSGEIKLDVDIRQPE